MSHFFHLLLHLVARLTVFLTVLFLLVATFLLTYQPLQAAAADQGSGQTILVQFEADTTPQMRDAVIAQMGGELVTWMQQILVAEIRLPVQDGATVAALPAIADGLVTYAEADQLVHATYEPSDPDFGVGMMSYGLKEIDALDAWDIVTGSQEIVIAVIDSGVMLDHPEFEGRLVDGFDFINNDFVADDDSGHGTHVAGVIAAALDNGEGIAGVCPNCRLMPVKVLNEDNLGSWAQLTQGILFAVDNGARVLNLSLGASVPSETLKNAIEYAVESGVVVVAAAGNYGSDKPFYPAALDGVIAVGATNRKGERWAKSDYGSYIDFVAPGELIYSTYNDMDNLYRGYTYMSGTSMAAPYVSGIAGLLLSVVPSLPAESVNDALKLGAKDLGAEGWDREYGHGLVNAKDALFAPVPGLLEAVGEIHDPDPGLAVFLPTLSKN